MSNLKDEKTGASEEETESVFKRCSAMGKVDAKKSTSEKKLQNKTSTLSGDTIFGGTSSSSENEQKRLSPDRRQKTSIKNKQKDFSKCQTDKESINTSSDIFKKLSPAKEKKVSFESKNDQDLFLKVQTIDKSREDSLPPLDFEENYLIAQSDILRQASLDYDRRMQEHKEMQKNDDDDIKEINVESETNDGLSTTFRDSNLNEKHDDSNAFTSTNQKQKILLLNQILDPNKNIDENPQEPKSGIDSESTHIEIKPENSEKILSDKESEIYAKIREMITSDYLLRSEESLKDPDSMSLKDLLESDKKELVKQNSLKEMRRYLDKKWLERNKKGKNDLRRKSEEKNVGSEKVVPIVMQRRSLSFDEEILI